MIPSVIDSHQHRRTDALNEPLARCAAGPMDLATAHFAISGYRLVRERLCQVGAFRLLIGAKPKAGAGVGPPWLERELAAPAVEVRSGGTIQFARKTR